MPGFTIGYFSPCYTATYAQTWAPESTEQSAGTMHPHGLLSAGGQPGTRGHQGRSRSMGDP